MNLIDSVDRGKSQSPFRVFSGYLSIILWFVASMRLLMISLTSYGDSLLWIVGMDGQT